MWSSPIISAFLSAFACIHFCANVLVGVLKVDYDENAISIS